MQDVQMTGELRTEMGTKAAKELRASGRIPCVMYGGKGENIHFTVDPNEVKHVIFTPEFKISNINIDGKNYRCIVREIQFHPVTDEISHIDFLALQDRSEEHTSELQSRGHLVCRLLLEKKKDRLLPHLS